MNNSRGFTLSGIISVITAIGFILVAILLIIKVTKTDKAYNDLNNQATETAQKRKAEIIISSVELAYANTIIGFPNGIPTLEAVKGKFDVPGAEWNENEIVTNLDFNCTVDVSSNILHVTCLEYETQKMMQISN